jgi:hypothetical protein
MSQAYRPPLPGTGIALLSLRPQKAHQKRSRKGVEGAWDILEAFSDFAGTCDRRELQRKMVWKVTELNGIFYESRRTRPRRQAANDVTGN